MLTKSKIQQYNSLLLQRLSLVLNLRPDFIQTYMINELIQECSLTTKEAFSLLLAQICGFDTGNHLEHRELYDYYFDKMVHPLDSSYYEQNLYYKSIHIPSIQTGRWELKQECYQPYEAFVCNDMIQLENGQLIPQIGFFDKVFSYPAVLENGREWMFITPNEIETMQPVIDEASGHVLTYGLGLGYFAYMVSEKSCVSSITIVETNPSVIQLFRTYILPQFHHPEKITIIQEDAFVYAKNLRKKENGSYDFIFTDLWHDPMDGIDMYLKMKQYEEKDSGCIYRYWIEQTMKCYL